MSEQGSDGQQRDKLVLRLLKTPPQPRPKAGAAGETGTRARQRVESQRQEISGMTEKAKATKPDDPEVYRRFAETARELEVDESADAMDRAFERVFKPKKPNDTPPTKQKPR